MTGSKNKIRAKKIREVTKQLLLTIAILSTAIYTVSGGLLVGYIMGQTEHLGLSFPQKTVLVFIGLGFFTATFFLGRLSEKHQKWTRVFRYGRHDK